MFNSQELTAYQSAVNLSLLNDIIAFVRDTSEASPAKRLALRQDCIFLDSKFFGDSLQKKYGFLYLGELLERYEERFGMSIQDFRAISLALAYTKELADDSMFIGPQRRNFIQQLKRRADGDIYLTGALYLLEVKPKLQSKLAELPASTEELIFAVSLFQNQADSFQNFKTRLLDYLGAGRTMPITGNMKAMCWLIFWLAIESKSIRGKDMALFRALTALPVSHVKRESKHHEILLAHCYTHLEIAYANMMSVLLQASPEARRTAASSIHNCSGLPLELSQEQKNLLLEPYTASRTLFSRAMFDEIWTLLESCPGVKNILQLLHELGIQENLCLDNYEAMAQNMPEYDRLLRSIARQIDAPAMGNFIAFWKKSCCTLYELRRMERWISTHPGQNWDSLLSNYSGYVNLLYGKRFKQVDLADVTDYQENILIYAITRNKKHFIRLVDEHPEVFLRLPRSSMLFQESLYQEHFNLNELTEKTLSECAGMAQGRLPAEKLSPGYQYSFPELKTLYGLPGVYFKFYAALQSNSKDYKLKVLKQLCRRKLLCSSMTEADLTVLAGCLSVKTLYDWMETNFRHISGLTAEDAVQILIHLDELRHILPTCQSQADVQLALRNLKSLKQYASIEALRENIIQVDTGWKSLAETMGLTPEFLARYHDNILSFLCSDGAYIAKKYSDCLDNQHREAYFRVVKAELMGKLDQLKYFEGDLQRELDSPLTGPVKTGWKRNLYIVQNDLEVRERDDFIATMLLGEQPYHTCLSYINGAHRECLLSSFDSNKKILYATVDGRIVGRAFLRLTKGRLAGENQDSGFTFVDLENAVSRTELPLSREQITLFLERPYISGVGPALEQRVKQMFVELACRKADEMNVTPVLNVSYQDSCKTDFARTRYDIYISASKAGKQYLDSLDGEASVTK